MVVLLWLLLGLAGTVLAAIMVVAVTPLYLRLSAVAGAAPRFCLDLWLLGGLTPRLRLFDSARRRKKRANAKEGSGKNRKSGRRRGGLNRATGLRMMQAGPDFIRGELRRLHIDELSVDADFGLGDPADTGRLYGLFCPFIYALPRGNPSLALRPDFTRARLDGTAVLALHFTPGSLLIPAIRFGWNVFVRRS